MASTTNEFDVAQWIERFNRDISGQAVAYIVHQQPDDGYYGEMVFLRCIDRFDKKHPEQYAQDKRDAEAFVRSMVSSPVKLNWYGEDLYVDPVRS